MILEIKPSAEGGLKEGTTAEIRLKDQGIFEFVESLEKTRQRALFMKRQKAHEEAEEGLRGFLNPCRGSFSSDCVAYSTVFLASHRNAPCHHERRDSI